MKILYFFENIEETLWVHFGNITCKPRFSISRNNFRKKTPKTLPLKNFTLSIREYFVPHIA